MGGNSDVTGLVIIVGLLVVAGAAMAWLGRLPKADQSVGGQATTMSKLGAIGWLLIVIGVALTGISFTMGITVESTTYENYSAVISDVVNIGMVADRAMVFQGGLALMIIGTVLACTGHVINSRPRP